MFLRLLMCKTQMFFLVGTGQASNHGVLKGNADFQVTCKFISNFTYSELRYVLSFYTNDGSKRDHRIQLNNLHQDNAIESIDSTTTVSTKTTPLTTSTTTPRTTITSTTMKTTSTTTPITSTTTPTTSTTTTSTTTTIVTTTEDPSEQYDFLDVVKNLMYCKTYNFSLYAEGYDGLGSSSRVFTSAATENIDEMAPPSLVTVQGIEEDSIEIIWFPPEGNSLACLEKYEVIWQNLDDNNDMGSSEVDFEETSFVISMQLHN